tara:strand:- start:344 stop:505 length:162 start_codon:yes stop_codon:yes gene_type:complete
VKLSTDQVSNLFGLMEDTVEYYCDKEVVSGETVWFAILTMAKMKLSDISDESK